MDLKIKQDKTMMKWTLKKLKKEAWRIFSIYIRLRDKGICFTCGKILPDYYDRYGSLREGWKSGHAGHFITAGNCGLALYFHEKNVHCQCYHCNINLSGNWLAYERRIITVYGQETCDELKRLQGQSDVKYKNFEYVDLIKKYAKKIETLKG